MVASGSVGVGVDYPRGMLEGCAVQVMGVVQEEVEKANEREAAATATGDNSNSTAATGSAASVAAATITNSTTSNNASTATSRATADADAGANADAGMSGSEWVLDGILSKRASGLIPRWHKRYFAVTGDGCMIYADDEEALMEGKEKGRIDLTTATVSRQRKFITLTFTDAKQLQLQATNEEWAVAWEGAMKKAAAAAAAAGGSTGSSGSGSAGLSQYSHYAPRKGTLVFARKASRQSISAGGSSAGAGAGAGLLAGGGVSPPSSPASAAPASASALPSAVSEWTPEHVASWVGSFGSDYGQYGQSIVSNGVNGEALLDEFGDDELDAIGVQKTFHRKKIAREARKLGQE